MRDFFAPCLNVVEANLLKRILTLLLLLAVFNWLLIKGGFDTGTYWHFPISVFSGPHFSIQNIPWLLVFCILVALATFRIQQASGTEIFLWGLGLTISSNLMQGGISGGLVAPLAGSGIEYFDDALKITDAGAWLRDFNSAQHSLLTHSRTHPPFAVLFHYWVGELVAHHPLGVALIFCALTALVPLAFRELLRALEVDESIRNPLTLLLILMPGFSIYGAVSFDSIIALPFTMALLGLVWMLRGERLVEGSLLFGASSLVSHLLTFGSLFLCAVALLLAVDSLLTQRSWRPLLLIGTAFMIQLGFFLVFQHYGYDHLQAFKTASRIENPSGFMLFSSPVRYVMTRIENTGELVVFFSFGVSAVILARLMTFVPGRPFVRRVAVAGLFVLLMVFLTGAFRRGETGRACLFIYPYALLLCSHLSSARLLPLIGAAALQTAAMQLFGSYHW